MRKQYGDVYILPSFFSVGNVFFGFLSILFCFQGKYSWAAFWIFIAAGLDALDGIVARVTKSQSDFGTELDSLADAISFGAAPALLIYFWGLRLAGTAGVFFSFIFLCAAVLRLARYNVLQKFQVDRRHYTGLTVPSGSIFLSAIVFYHPQPLVDKELAFLFAVLTLFVACCMVSTMKYRNFLHFNFRRRIELKSAFLMAVILAGLIFYAKEFLLAFFSINVFSGPAVHLFRLLREKPGERKKRERAARIEPRP